MKTKMINVLIWFKKELVFNFKLQPTPKSFDLDIEIGYVWLAVIAGLIIFNLMY